MVGPAQRRRLSGEGIETAEELGTLIRLNVPLGQGYLFGKPAPIS